MKYREAHQEEYKNLQKEYYIKCKEDPEFKEKKKEKNRLAYLRRKEKMNRII